MKRVEYKINFIAALEKKMDEAGWGIKTRLADHLGVKPPFITKILRGSGSEKHRRLIADFFDCSYDDFLLFGHNARNPKEDEKNREEEEYERIGIEEIFQLLSSIERKVDRLEDMEKKLSRFEEIFDNFTKRKRRG